jgi:hypothetical protein
MTKRDIPDDVRQKVIESIAQFNRKNFPGGQIAYVGRFKGNCLYLDRDEYGTRSQVCRLTYKGKPDNWDFAIFKYSSEQYDPDEWMFPGSDKVDGTVEGAMWAGLEAYPP